ncbi:MAG: hypothetical protein WC742_13130 [Gallionellaceae bacterium]
MNFVKKPKVLLAVVAVMSCNVFYEAPVSALELFNEPGLLAVLRKNQVLSARDVEAIKNEYPKYEINGNLQFQYVYADADIAASKVNEINFRRANLSFVGRVSEKFSVVIEPEFGKGQSALRDAFIAYRSPNFGIFAGNHSSAFGAEAMKNDINLRFVERNLTSNISPGRMLGVSVITSLLDNKIKAQAGVWNSTISSKSEAGLINNLLSDKQIFGVNSEVLAKNIFVQAARIGFSTNGYKDFYSSGGGFTGDENFNHEFGVDVGASYYNSSAATDASTPGSTSLNGANAFGADAAFKFWRFTGEVEYAKRNLQWWQYNALSGSVPVDSAQTSYSAQASFLLSDNLSLAVRQESFVYDSSGKVLKGVYGQDQDSWTTAGLTYFSKEQNTKIQMNYVMKSETFSNGLSDPKNNTVLIQATSYF